MRWLAAALVVTTLGCCGCERRRELRTFFPELYAEDPAEQAASDVVRLPDRYLSKRSAVAALARDVLGVPVRDLQMGGGAVGPPVAVSVRTGDPGAFRSKLMFSYTSRRLLSAELMPHPDRMGHTSREARLLGDELIAKCFPKIPALLMFDDEWLREGAWVVAWLGMDGMALSGDVATVRMSAETGRLIWYRQWIAPLRPKREQFEGVRNDFALRADRFTRRARDEVAAHGLDPNSFEWMPRFVRSWAEHPQAGPVWVVLGVRPRPETWLQTDREGDERINLIFEAHTGELLVARERDWWDFDPARAEMQLVNAGVIPGVQQGPRRPQERQAGI